jgi:hypothetical protein
MSRGRKNADSRVPAFRKSNDVGRPIVYFGTATDN